MNVYEQYKKMNEKIMRHVFNIMKKVYTVIALNYGNNA